MVSSRSIRVLFLGSLVAATVGMIALTGWLLWPEWQRYSALRRLEEAGRTADVERFLDAVEAIGNLPADERLVGDLVERVKDRDAGVRAYSILTLAVLQPRPVSVVPLLIATLDNPNEDDFVRAASAAALGVFGEEVQQTLPSLIEAAKTADSKSDLWFASMETVLRIGGADAIRQNGLIEWSGLRLPSSETTAREHADFLFSVANTGF